MSYNKLSSEEAEAKLLAAFAALVWLIPALIFTEIYIKYNTGENLGISSALVTILTTLFWIVLLLRVVKVVDQQLDKQREHELELLEKKKRDRT